MKAKLKNLLTNEIITVHATTDSPDSSYGIPAWVDADNNSYGQVPYSPPLGFEIFDVVEDDTANGEADPSAYSLVYDHALLCGLVPSGKTPHIDAMAEAGLLEELTPEQAAKVVVIAQTAYRRGQASMGAERIDNDAVWINGVGGIEKQSDGTWKLTMPDGGIDTSAAASALGKRGGESTSEAKQRASRANGREKGGRSAIKREPRGEYRGFTLYYREVAFQPWSVEIDGKFINCASEAAAKKRIDERD